MKCRVRATGNVQKKSCKNLEMITVSWGQGQDGEGRCRGQGKRGGDGIRRFITIEFSVERFLQVRKGP